MTGAPADRLVEDWIAAQRAEATRRAYRTTVGQWSDWCAVRGVDLLEVSRRDGDDWRTHLQQQGRAARTINARIAGVASLYDYLVDRGAMEGNPFKAVKREEVDQRQGETAALDEVGAAAVLEAAQKAGPRTHVAVALLLFTAIRANELLTLDVSTLRDENGTLVARIRRKGGRQDVLPLTDRLAHDVEELRGDRKAGPLLAQASGAGWSYWQLHAAVVAAGKAARIEGVTPHVLRTTWATLALARGVPLADVQDVMGHASADTTRGYDRRRDSIERRMSAMTVVEDLLIPRGVT